MSSVRTGVSSNRGGSGLSRRIGLANSRPSKWRCFLGRSGARNRTAAGTVIFRWPPPILPVDLL